MKISGKEWKAYYNDKSAFPDGAYHEDEEILINGEDREDAFDNLQDTDEVTLVGGVYCKTEHDREGTSLEAHFRRWRKRQGGKTYCVFVPEDKEVKLRATLKKLGLKLT